jgi:hypothetical protein
MKTLSNNQDDDSNIKCSKVIANGMSSKAIQWVFDNSGLFMLDLIGVSYKTVQRIANQLKKEYPNDIFEVEFTNGDVVKSEIFYESEELKPIF